MCSLKIGLFRHQALIERYVVIAGYPDSTYREQAMTRSEFAAGLNAAIERVNELMRLVVWTSVP